MKICGLCSSQLGVRKFRYKDGYVCEKCYKYASRNYTETISHKSLDEMKALYEASLSREENLPMFEVTKRIGNYILFDMKRKRMCIPNNRIFTQNKLPEFFNFKSIKKVCFETDKSYQIENILRHIKMNDKIVITKLAIVVHFEEGIKEIVFLSSPARINSFAFKRIFYFAKEAYETLQSELSFDRFGDEYEKDRTYN